MQEKKYCYIGQGWLATTNVDSDGHQLTEEHLKKMIKELDEYPSRRIINFNHNPEDKMGELIKWEIRDIGDFLGVFITHGVYKGREDIAEKIKDGSIKGFSYTAMELGGVNSEEDFDKMDIKIDLDGKDISEVEKVLKNEGITPIIKYNKSADVLCQIAFYSGLLASFLTIIKALYNLYNAGKINNPSITFNDCTFNFNDQSYEEMAKEVKEKWVR